MPKNNHYTLSFEDAKKIVHSYGFKTHPEYSRFMNSSKRPVNLPKAPQYIYKDQWVSWPDFLGVKQGAKTPTKRNILVRGSAKQFLPYAKAKAFVQKIGLKSHKEYRLWSKSDRPTNIPGHPSDFYKDEFEGWAEYLGTKTEPKAQQMPDLFVEKPVDKPVVLPNLHSINKIAKEIKAGQRAEEIYQKASRLSGLLIEFDELAEKSMQVWRNAYINHLASLAFKYENQKNDLHPTISLQHAIDAAIKNPVTATLMVSLETELARSMWAGHNIGEEKYEGLPVDHAIEMLTSRGWEWYNYDGRCRTLISPLIGLQINIFEIPSENGEYWVVDKIEFDLDHVSL